MGQRAEPLDPYGQPQQGLREVEGQGWHCCTMGVRGGVEGALETDMLHLALRVEMENPMFHRGHQGALER